MREQHHSERRRDRGAETSGSVDGLRRQSLFGYDLVDAERLEQVVDAVMDHHGDPDTLPVLLTPNVDIMVQLDEEPHSVEADMFRRAQYVLPDGMPIVVASRLLGRRLAARLPGSGLFELLWPRLAAEGDPVVVLCSDQAIADRLEKDHGAARCIVPPMFDLTDDAERTAVIDALSHEVDESGARRVLLGLGHPKDATIAAELHDRWDARLGVDRSDRPLCLGLGGSFAMYVGLRRRAPEWVQRIGMEWFYRFAQEPRRLFHRYFVRDTAFLGILLRERKRLRSGRG